MQDDISNIFEAYLHIYLIHITNTILLFRMKGHMESDHPSNLLILPLILPYAEKWSDMRLSSNITKSNVGFFNMKEKSK